MRLQKFITAANNFGKEKIPFFFLLDFELNSPFFCKLNETANKNIFFEVNEIKNYKERKINNISELCMKTFPIDFRKYTIAFNRVKQNLNMGNTYLLNLTFPTPIKINRTLIDLFFEAKAQYKLYFKNQFVIFSPECFVKTKEDFIYSYPMKGTIDADISDAREIILSDKKEEWEHNTIVDLLRNDLSIISTDIEITKFRFISKIKTNKKNLLQVSSEIRGKLTPDWNENIGNILCKMLPAGSISGAPKQKTVEIINTVEKNRRGYFTGIFGIFDGNDIDAAVNIRYIENSENGIRFRSGGGITTNSDLKTEYNEMIDKVYVPII